MNMFITVDKKWAIGRGRDVFVRIPENEQLIRRETTGKVVVMSKSVAEHFPGGYSYRDRINVILTHDSNCNYKEAKVAHSTEELMEILKDYNSESIYVLGGEKIFKTMLPLCDTVDVTYIDYEYDADAYFVNLDENEDFVMTQESDERTYFDLIYVFRRYERKK